MPSSWCQRAICLLSAASIFVHVGCAGLLADPRNSDLPIEIDPAKLTIVRAGAFEANGKLYVAGSVEKSFGSLSAMPSHIHVLLIDQSGKIFAGKEDRVGSHSGRSGRRVRRSTFVVSFDIPTARQSALIRIVGCRGHGAGFFLTGA